MDDPLAEELLRRAEQDQEARRTADSDPDLMMRVDAENLPWLKGIIEARGWPTRSMVGEEASHAAWLLVQHADRDVAFQRRCLELLTAAAADGEARQQDVAYLTDRVYLAEGATPGVRNPGHGPGRAVGAPALQDPDTVDERRTAIGLEPLKGYLTWFGDPPTPNILPCGECGTSLEFWTPEPGDQLQVTCPNCGWMMTLSTGPK